MKDDNLFEIACELNRIATAFEAFNTAIAEFSPRMKSLEESAASIATSVEKWRYGNHE